MNNLVQRWHAAKRKVRRLEAQVMVAEAAEAAGARRPVGKVLNRELAEAQNAAEEARKDCVDAIRLRRELVAHPR